MAFDLVFCLIIVYDEESGVRGEILNE